MARAAPIAGIIDSELHTDVKSAMWRLAEFEEVINELEEHVSRNLIFGVTDTPSANRKAWRLLMGKFPRMYWGGCMSHEISLYMGDIAKNDLTIYNFTTRWTTSWRERRMRQGKPERMKV